MVHDGADAITLVDEIVDYMEDLPAIFPEAKLGSQSEILYEFGQILASRAEMTKVFHLDARQYATIIADILVRHFMERTMVSQDGRRHVPIAAMVMDYLPILLEMTSNQVAAFRVQSLLSQNHRLRLAFLARESFVCH